MIRKVITIRAVLKSIVPCLMVLAMEYRLLWWPEMCKIYTTNTVYNRNYLPSYIWHNSYTTIHTYNIFIFFYVWASSTVYIDCSVIHYTEALQLITDIPKIEYI